MDKLTLPLEGANIIISLELSEDSKHTKMYLVTSEEKYLGSMNLERTQKVVKKMKDKFEQYLNGTLYTKYDATGLFAYSETQIDAAFVYKDLNPRIKFCFCYYELEKSEILEFRISDEMIKKWINQLDYILSVLELHAPRDEGA